MTLWTKKKVTCMKSTLGPPDSPAAGAVVPVSLRGEDSFLHSLPFQLPSTLSSVCLFIVNIDAVQFSATLMGVSSSFLHPDADPVGFGEGLKKFPL